MQGEGGKGLAALTRVLQDRTGIGDAGAAGLAEGLKVNSSLPGLSLVRLFLFFVCFCGGDAGRGRGGGGLHSRVCCRTRME